MNDTIKRKKGRPAGSVSFTNLTLAELNQRFKPEDSIPVGRLFLQKGKLSPQTISDNVGAEIKARVAGEVFISPATESSSMVEMTLFE